VDVCSLYPYVLKTGIFPLDQFTIYQVYKYEMTILETDDAPMQCEVQRFNIIHYAILLYHQQVSNAQSDLIEKCLHSIVLPCLI